jgi:glycerol-3-phosphate dehydrogenase
MKRRVCVLGAGAWGAALAIRLAANGHMVTLSDPRPGVVPKELFGPFPTSLHLHTQPPAALAAADLCVVACPSPHLRAISRALLAPHLPPAALVVSACKGLEEATLL